MTEAELLMEAAWANCRVVFYPRMDDPRGDYPLEHAPAAGKDMRAAIENRLRELIVAAPDVHLSSGGKRDEPIYTRRDVGALIAVALAAAHHRRPADKPEGTP